MKIISIMMLAMLASCKTLVIAPIKYKRYRIVETQPHHVTCQPEGDYPNRFVRSKIRFINRSACYRSSAYKTISRRLGGY